MPFYRQDTWRVELGGKRIVFRGDGNGRNGNPQILAKGADLLVAHLAVPERTQGGELRWHMPPSLIGEIAGEAEVSAIVLGHRMTRTLGKEGETRAAIAKAYSGPVTLADDLSCFPCAKKGGRHNPCLGTEWRADHAGARSPPWLIARFSREGGN